MKRDERRREPNVEEYFGVPLLTADAWVLLANGAYWDHTDAIGRRQWDDARDEWRDRWDATFPSSIADEVDEAE